VARPPVTVVMPFAGDASAAHSALAALAALRVGPGDERILVDNSAAGASVGGTVSGIAIVPASGEHSAAHARNTGAAHARGDWLLFLDADCTAPPDLLDRYFLEPVAPEVGALAGEVLPAVAGGPARSARAAATLAERYGAARSFLSQRAHLAHGYLPRAAAANLLVRRAAFEQLGGFYEGLRAAEDTDFSWRLQLAGWRLELRAAAHVEHRYRTTVADLRRQWRGYAAGRAWLARRYPGFTPEPAAARAWQRARARVLVRRLRRHGRSAPAMLRSQSGSSAFRDRERTRRRRDRAAFFALDALLAGEELAGLTLSNRPAPVAPEAPVEVVLVAERFPLPDDPLVEFACSLDRARVEAAARPERPAAAGLRIDYREDDGAAARALALTRLVVRHPGRSLRDRLRRGSGAPSLASLAPVVLRLEGDRGARVHGLGGESARVLAARLAALSGHQHEHHLHWPFRLRHEGRP
jgi:GT2 family glycosyltransferase